MISEKKLLRELNKELEKARARYNEANCEDCDSDLVFYGAICSALETTIKLINKQPIVTPKIADSLYKGKPKWIPCSSEVFPDGDFVLLSFENCPTPFVGRFKSDDEGGAFYLGIDGISCISLDLFVNAWMPLPKPYKEG